MTENNSVRPGKTLVPVEHLRKWRNILAFAEGFAKGFIGTDDDICGRLSTHIREIKQARTEITQAIEARKDAPHDDN